MDFETQTKRESEQDFFLSEQENWRGVTCRSIPVTPNAILAFGVTVTHSTLFYGAVCNGLPR